MERRIKITDNLVTKIVSGVKDKHHIGADEYGIYTTDDEEGRVISFISDYNILKITLENGIYSLRYADSLGCCGKGEPFYFSTSERSIIEKVIEEFGNFNNLLGNKN